MGRVYSLMYCRYIILTAEAEAFQDLRNLKINVPHNRPGVFGLRLIQGYDCMS